MSKAKQRIRGGAKVERRTPITNDVIRQGSAVTMSTPGTPVGVVPLRGVRVRESLRGTVAHQDEDLCSTGETWDADR